MSKKKKIIFSVIAIVFVIAIIISTMFFFMFKETALEKLFDTNREHFDTLTSVDTTIVLYCDATQTIENKESTMTEDWTTIVKSHLPSGTAFADYDSSIMQDGHTYSIKRTLYKVNEDESKKTYFNEIFYGKDGGWLYDKTNEQLENFIKCQDFDLIAKREANFNLEKDLVELNGISCYKATGTTFKVEEISNYYGITDMIGAFGDNYNIIGSTNVNTDIYAEITIYFREDTNLIYCIEYNFTDILKHIFKANTKQELNDAEFIFTIYFNEFNTLEEITVSDEIKNSAGEYVGNEIENPIDIADENYAITGSLNFHFGQLVKEYADKFEISQVVWPENTDEDVTLIKSGKTTSLVFSDENGNSFFVEVVNLSNEALHYLDCHISCVDININQYPDFDNIVFADNITTKSTPEDCQDLLGRYTGKHDNGSSIVYIWTSYIDYCRIEISFNKETNKIDSYKLYSWDLNYFLSQ